MVTGRIILFITSLLFSTMLSAAMLTATVDKKEILTGEHVLLTLSLVNSDTRLRAEGISPNVDLTLLTKDFELGVPREDHRFNIFRNRGRSTSELKVELFPKQAGKFVIPSFMVDGISSEPIHIQVHKGTVETTPQVFTRNGVSKNSGWQREQFIAYLDLYHRIELKSAKLGGEIDTEPTQLELHKLTQSERKEQVTGITYNVVRTAWAITPLLSQSYKIYLPDIWIETSDDRKIRLPFNEQDIDVRPLPDNVPPLTMIGKPVLSQTAFTESAHVNRVSPWTITIRAPASPASFPEELPSLNMPDNIKMYSDATERTIDQESDPITGVANYHVYLIPLSAGEFTLPQIRIPYFDPERGAMDVAVLDGQTFSVEPALQSTAPTPILTDLPTSIQQSTATSGAQGSAFTWQIISIVLAVLWLITLGLWWDMYHRSKNVTTVQKPKPAQAGQHPLQTVLLEALESRTLEEGLNRWEQVHGQDPDIHNTVRAVQKFCYGGDKSIQENETREAVKKAIRKIHAASATITPPDSWSPRSFTPRLTFTEEQR